MFENLLDYYEIQDTIYSWQSTKTYTGIHKTTDKKVIIKEFSKDSILNATEDAWIHTPVIFDVESFNYIKNIKETLSVANHTNIAKIYDIEHSRDKYYFIREMVDGKAINDLGLLDESQILSIATQIASGLEFLHSLGILHRDLKPENIYVTNEGTVKIVDFGLAEKYLFLNPSSSSHMQYTAPEVFLHKTYDYRSDLYSIGVILYELITGVPPVNIEKCSKYYSFFESSDLISLDELKKSDVSEGFKAVIESLLQLHPIDRIQSAYLLEDKFLRLSPETYYECTPYKRLAGEKYLNKSEFFNRQDEVKYLKSKIDNTTKGNNHIELLFADMGLGKTSFINELHSYSVFKQYNTIYYKLTDQAEGIFFEGIIDSIYKQLEKSYFSSEIVFGYDPFTVEEKQNIKQIREELKDLNARFSETQDNKYKIYEKIWDFITIFLRNRNDAPLILFVDNAQNINPNYLDLIFYLVNKSNNSKFFMLLSFSNYHSSAFTQPEFLARIKKTPNTHTTHLKPLPDKDLKNLLLSMLGQKDFKANLIEKIVQASQNNPYLAKEILKYLVNNGIIYKIGASWESMIEDISSIEFPSSIKNITADKLNKLNEKEMTILEWFSVLGSSIQLNDLISLITKHEDAKDFALDKIINHINKLREQSFINKEFTNYEVKYYLANQLLKKLTYKLINPARRKQLHGYIATYLEEKFPGRLKDIAFHYSLSKFTKKAINYLISSAHQLKKSKNYSGAMNELVKANQLLDSISTCKWVKVKILSELGKLFLLSGNEMEAIKLYREGYHISTNPFEKSYLNNQIGRCLFLLGNMHEAIGYFEKARNMLLHEETKLNLSILNNISKSYMELKNVAKARKYINELHSTAIKLGNDKYIGRSLGLLGEIYEKEGNFAKAIEFFNKALELLESAEASVDVLNILAKLGKLYYENRKYKESFKYFYKTEDLAKNLGLMNHYLESEIYLGIINFSLGFLSKAKRYYKNCIDVASELNNHYLMGRASNNLAITEGLLGNYDLAIEYETKCIEIYERIKRFDLVANSLNVTGNMYLSKGDIDEAYIYFKKAYNLGKFESDIDFYCEALKGIAEVNYLRGEYEEALSGIVKVFASSNPELILPAKLVHAKILYKLGKDKEAIDIFLANIEECKVSDRALDLARSLFEYGAYLLEQMQVLEAKDILLQSRAIFNQFEVNSEVRKVDNVLQKLTATSTDEQLSLKDKIYKLESKNQKLTKLLSIVHSINSEYQLENILSIIVKNAIEIFGAERGFLFLTDTEGELSRVLAKNVRMEDIEESETQYSPSILDEVAATKAPVLLYNAQTDKRFASCSAVKRLDLHSVVCIPFISKNIFLGALYIDNHFIKGLFAEEDMDFLKVLSDQAAIAIEKAQMYERITNFNIELKEKLIQKEQELKEAEKERIKTEKLATVAQIAVSLNHEINNPLTNILGGIYLIEKRIGEDEGCKSSGNQSLVRKKLHSIKKSADRISEITQKLRKITQPVFKEYVNGIGMLDIDSK